MSKNWKFFERVNITRSGDNSENPQLYMIRWILLRTPWFSIMLHKFLLSDDDCLHDHPWPFWSFIFWGHYYEWANLAELPPTKTYVWKGEQTRLGPDGKTQVRRKFSAPTLLHRRASWKHRVEIDKPCWTLVVTTRNVRKWGFWTKSGWVHHTQYNSSIKCD